MTDRDTTLQINPDLANLTLVAVVRRLAGDASWSQARRLIAARRVLVDGTIVLDDARRLNVGEVVTLRDQSSRPLPGEQDVTILHADEHVIVVDKPPGVQTVRRPEERGWDEQRKGRQPTLDELVQRLIPGPAIRAVHRLDRDTSGVMLFARSPRAQQALTRLFAAHEVRRIYWAAVLGPLEGRRTIESWLVRDRGDGLRGSSPPGPAAPEARHAVTDVGAVEQLGDRYTVIECRLQTGRTHQIRIHLAEAGHMLCGERVYTRPAPHADAVVDTSDAPRQALHSIQVEFRHPVSGQLMRLTAPLAKDLLHWIDRLRAT